MVDRKMAWVAKIDNIQPILGADKIEVITIGGWKVVAAKECNYKINDLVVYFTIDSFIPHAVAPFLTKEGHSPKSYNGVEGQRLKTVKLRGQISQGLLLPMSDLFEAFVGSQYDEDQEHAELQAIFDRVAIEGFDATDLLGIQKWEPELAANLIGKAKGNFPSFLCKTDQERIQNLTKYLSKWVGEGEPWEITEKLDGSSMTVYIKEDGTVGVCSRNLDLIETPENSFWQIYNSKVNFSQDEINSLLEQFPKGVAFQGELVGPGIQKNRYGIGELEFFIFDVFDIAKYKYLGHADRIGVVELFGLNHVPILGFPKYLTDIGTSVTDFLVFAEAKSILNKNVEREGVVFKRIDGGESFKAISNKFLLKGGEE